MTDLSLFVRHLFVFWSTQQTPLLKIAVLFSVNMTFLGRGISGFVYVKSVAILGTRCYPVGTPTHVCTHHSRWSHAPVQQRLQMSRETERGRRTRVSNSRVLQSRTVCRSLYVLFTRGLLLLFFLLLYIYQLTSVFSSCVFSIDNLRPTILYYFSCCQFMVLSTSCPFFFIFPHLLFSRRHEFILFFLLVSRRRGDTRIYTHSHSHIF